jgi:hypothetical protein
MTDQNRTPIVQRLLQLVQELYAETETLSEGEGDLQLWYNRGYANGVARVLCDLGHGRQLEGAVRLDADDRIAGQEFLPWGKAYLHGLEMGEKESREVL